MKTSIKKWMLMGMALLTVVLLNAACDRGLSGNYEERYDTLLDVSADGTSTVILNNLKSALISTADLSAGELKWLLQMKDEEKLARDVYSALYEKWQSNVFSNIKNAESNHLNAVLSLLTYYGQDAAVKAAGEFENPDFKALYDELVAKGSESLAEAYKTGALIEEMDIKDLTEALDAVANANIIMVFENLQKGSRNHLRAFVRQLTSMGASYTPVYLSASDFNSIISTPTEKGRQYRMGGGQHEGNGRGKMYRGNR